MKSTDITKENIDTAILLDFYGQLLTQKALLIMELYYNEDMSLSEISEITKTTRQAVHDSVKRSITSLKDYENKLGLVKRFNQQKEIISIALEDLDQNDFQSAKEKLDKLITTL